jgi:hypothetical protein
MCGKRADGYNFLTMSKPKKYEKVTSGNGGPIECKNDTLKLCGNADTTIEPSKAWCIPKDKTCPLTYIGFDSSGE